MIRKEIYFLKEKVVNRDQPKTPYYSNVTDCFSTNTFDPKNSNKKDVESILFSFDLIISTLLKKK